jgi:integrase
MATRRDNGEGSKIYQYPNGRFWKKVTYKDPDTGRSKRTTISGATKEEIREKEKDLYNKAAAGLKVNAGKMLLGDWIKKWLETDKKSAVEYTSYNHYTKTAELHIYDAAIAKIQLEQIKRIDIQKFFNEKSKELLPATLLVIKAIISNAFSAAILDNMIVRSPVDRIKLPKIEKKKINPFNKEEIEKILSIADKDNGMYTIVFLGVCTGLRAGEICGLKWADIDFKRKEIYIRQQAKKDISNNTLSLGKLKTDGSYRVIPIKDKLIDVLKWHKKLQDKAKNDFGQDYNKLGLVFCREDSSILGASLVGQRFARLVKKAGIDHKSIHQLRHTFASIAISQNQSIKAISAVLGHSDITTTLQKYGHLLPGDQASVIESIANYFSL